VTVHLYTLCWNEADMLGFFFRHYDSWVDRYVIYDDGSSDGSLDLLCRHPRVELRRFSRTSPDSFVLSQRDLQNRVWKESRGRADWVVITALDEHLHLRRCPMSEYLEECTRAGVTLVPAVGYQMLSDEYPAAGEWLCQSRTQGAPYGLMNKLSLFKPDAIQETGYIVGRHLCAPAGELRYPARDELMNLHYKYLGFDRTLRRHREQSFAVGDVDVTERWGFQYHWRAEKLREDWEGFRARLVETGSPGFDPCLAFEPPIWWRAEDSPAGA